MNGSLLSQIRPGSTTVVSIYSPALNEIVEIKEVIVCNTTAAAHDFSIFLDHDGTSYDEGTALYFDEALAANTTKQIETSWWMRDSAGNMAVKTDTNDAFTFTVFGIIRTN